MIELLPTRRGIVDELRRLRGELGVPLQAALDTLRNVPAAIVGIDDRNGYEEFFSSSSVT